MIDISNDQAPIFERQTLAQYPVVSVELMNLEILKGKLSNPDQLTRLTRDMMLRLEGQLIAQGASIESLRDNVLFFSLKEYKSLADALAKALRLGVSLARKAIELQGVNLQMRVGIDILQSEDQRSTAAVPERLVAKPGQLIVSYGIYQLTQKQIPYETIGPLKVQGSMKTFFKVVTDAIQPAKQTPIVSTPAVPSLELIESPPNPSIQPEPKSSITPYIERTIEPLEAPEKISYEAPELLSVLSMPRQPNITYAQFQKAFEAELDDLLMQPEGRILAICAKEGAGKSALIGMNLAKLPQDSFYWMGGNFFDATADNQFPFGYWLDVVQNRLGFPSHGVPQKEGLEYLNNVLTSIFGDPVPAERLDFFKTLLSLEPCEPIGPAIRSKLGRMIPNILDFLIKLSQEKPVILVMEDVQYGDNPSLELLLQLLQHQLLKNRIHIILTYTPETLLIGPFQQTLSLLPFKEWVLDVVDEASLINIGQPPLGVPWQKLPEPLTAQLVEKGSPMFLEEAFRWLLIHRGLSIHPKTGKFMPEKNLKNLIVPEDLSQIILERFQALDDMTRSVLQMASALGERFSKEILADLTPLAEKLDDVLQFLWQQGFLIPDAGNIVRFRHHLVWQVVNQSITPPLKQEQHRLISDTLEKALKSGLSVNPVLMAYHAGQAGDSQKAMAAWHQAATWLAAIGSVTGANLAFLQFKADTSPAEQIQFLEAQALVNLDVYPHFAKSLLLQTLAYPLDQNNDTKAHMQRQLFLSQAYEKLGNFSQVVATLHRAQETLNSHEHALEHVALASEEVWFLTLQGNYQEALQVYNETVSPLLNQLEPQKIWDDPTFRVSMLRAELAWARIAIAQCRTETIDHIDRFLTQCDLKDEKALGLQFRLTRCWAFMLRGNYDTAKRDMQALLSEIEQLSGASDLAAWWGIIMMFYHTALADWDNAALILPNTLYHAELAKDYLAWSLCQVMAGAIAVGRASHNEAQTILEQAVTVCSQYQLSMPALMGWQWITENELALGHVDMANQFCLRALEVCQKPRIQNTLALFQLIIIQAKILMAQKDLKKAGVLLEEYWPQLVKSGYTPLVAEAAYQISVLYGTLSQTAPDTHKSRYLNHQRNFLERAENLWQDQGNQNRLRLVVSADAI